MAGGILDGLQSFGNGLGGILSGFGDRLNAAWDNPGFAGGIALLGARRGEEDKAIQNMLATMMAQRMFQSQRDDKKKADERDARDFAFRQAEAQRAQTNADRAHGLAVENANRPQIIGSEQSGYHLVYPRSIPKPGEAATPAGGQTTPLVPGAGQTPPGQPPQPANPLTTPLIPPTPRSFPAADKKAIFEAEDSAAQLKGTIETLNRARELNRQTFTGWGAGVRGSIGSTMPDWMIPDIFADRKGAEATSEFQRIMSGEAVKNMSETLKGASTDYEMKQFTSRLADPSTPPDERERIIDRMMSLAQRQQELNAKRITDLRGGTYFKPEGQQAAPAAAPPPSDMPKPNSPLSSQGGLPKLTSEAQFNALPSGTRFIAPDGSVRIKP